MRYFGNTLIMYNSMDLPTQVIDTLIVTYLVIFRKLEFIIEKHARNNVNKYGIRELSASLTDLFNSGTFQLPKLSTWI